MSEGNTTTKKKESQQFAQISLDLICRFDELTKYEVRLLCFLYGSRNRKTKKCNPGRKYISTKTGIDKGNLSRSIAGLEEKKWIVEQENGEFLLMENPPEKVVDSATEKVVESATEKPKKRLLIPQPKVVDSATESCGINNSHIKDLNTKGTQKEHKERNAPMSETSSDVPVFDFKVDVEALSIFEEWQRVLNHPKSTYDEKRQKKILSARKKFSAEQLKRVIQGVTFSPHHLGENSTRKKYDEISTIFRDTEQIEKFIGYADGAEAEAASRGAPPAPPKQSEQEKAYYAMLAATRAKSGTFQGNLSK